SFLMELHVYKDGEALSQAAAKWIADRIDTTLRSSPRFTIALSGGSTPKRLHQLLAAAPYNANVGPNGQATTGGVGQIDWSKLHIFWGDERAVPFEDSRNNA